MHHFHFHILTLIHYVRHARIVGSYLRYLGMMLLTLLFSLFFQLGAVPVSDAFAASDKDSLEFVAGSFSLSSVSWTAGLSDPAAHPAPLDAIQQQNTNLGVFHRLKPRIVMIPRMNRTPKPKSVYRCFTRAPGA